MSFLCKQYSIQFKKNAFCIGYKIKKIKLCRIAVNANILVPVINDNVRNTSYIDMSVWSVR